MSASSIYDKQFFDMHVPWRHEYVAIADTLCNLFIFSSVIDLGCGNGFILARLRELGKEVRGVDASLQALEAAPDTVKGFISLHDLAARFCVGKFDLVICTEVAEHLDAQFADVLVENICINSKGLVYFTAATPGQGGHYHVNEQTHSYWIEKFAGRGYELNYEFTHSFRSNLEAVVKAAWWLVKNAMIFRTT